MDAATYSKDTQRVQRGDRALTLREAEDLYGIPAHRLRQYRSERALDFFKLGRALFVSERSLIDFLERHREPAAAPIEDRVLSVANA